MLLPITTDVAVRRTPWVNYALIAINVAVFVGVSQIVSRSAVRGLMLNEQLMLWAESPRWYQFFTSMFMHGGWWHLIGNMVFLWVFGNALNYKLGHLTYLLFYLACGLAAGAGYVVFESRPVVGASGAIFGVAAGFAALYPLGRVTAVYFLFFVGVIELNGLIVVGYFIAVNLFYLSTGIESGTAYLAHLFGAFYGLVSALALLARGGVGRDQFDLLALFRRWRQRMAYATYTADANVRARAHYGRVAAPVDRAGRPLPVARPISEQARQIQELRAALAEAISHGQAERAGELYAQLLATDPEQVLPARQQVDLGNYLMSAGEHALAAAAYESLLAHYPAYESAEHIHLLLGVLYGRYLNDPSRAQPHLQEALPMLRNAAQRDFCQNELNHVASRR